MNDAKFTPEVMMSAYGKLFSPSGSGRWLFCTGSVGLEVKLRDRYPDSSQVSSIYASEGTAAHTLAAKCVQTDVSPHKFIGDTIAADGRDFKVDLEMANNVAIYVDYVLSHRTDGSLMDVEKTLDLTSVSPYVVSGTADAWIYQPDTKHLHVFDLKYGAGIYVEVKNNTQEMIYALGVRNELKRKHGISDIQNVTLHIIQPRANNGNNPPHAWSISPQALDWFHEFVLIAIREALSPRATFNPSEKNCRWCPGNSHCTARTEDAMRAAQLEFSHLVIHDATIPDLNGVISPIGQMYDSMPEPVLPNPDMLSANEIGVLLKWQNKVERFFKDIGARALQLKIGGHTVPGIKLVQGKSNRAWKNEQEAIIRVQSLGIDKKDLFNPPKFKSPAQIEQVFKARKLDARALSDLIIKPPGEMKLALATDKRPEVNPTTLAHHDFAAFAVDEE